MKLKVFLPRSSSKIKSIPYFSYKKYIHPHFNIYKCENCKFRSFSEPEISKHIETQHQKEVNNCCIMCGGSFSNRQQKEKCQAFHQVEALLIELEGEADPIDLHSERLITRGRTAKNKCKSALAALFDD